MKVETHGHTCHLRRLPAGIDFNLGLMSLAFLGFSGLFANLVGKEEHRC